MDTTSTAVTAEDAPQEPPQEQDAQLLLLPHEVLLIVLTETTPFAVCSLACVCRCLRAPCADEGVWRRQHARRWRWEVPPAAPRAADPSWRAEFSRRHKQDAKAAECVAALAKDSGSRADAWEQLLMMGEEVLESVAALCGDDSLPPAHRTEAAKALEGINQSAAQLSWGGLMRRAEAATRLGHPPPALEEGALILVRLYQTADRLRDTANGAPRVEDEVRLQLDSLATRLRTRLEPTASETGAASEEADPSATAVRELSTLLFAEEGFAGNAADYYNHTNSLLDHVLTSHKGIPISLSVLFSAVCARVGVELDAIGQPGHILLATRPRDGAGERERVFVDAFHAGELLDIRQCEAIVRSYGHPWSAEFARPVPPSEVWERMLRNLLNCHSEAGDLVHMRMVQRLREASRGQGGWKVPCPGGDDEAHVQASGGQRPQQRQLLQMLQLLQLQMNQEQDDD